MIPWKKLGIAQIPNNGGELQLSQRGEEFSIRLSGVRGELMNSRIYNSEQVLAELGCALIKEKSDAHVLVGGLGMGYTLAATLQAVAASAQVTVAELIPEVVEWNKGPLRDPRTKVVLGDVAELLENQHEQYDAILLDVDNGPEGLTHTDNNWLYSQRGLESISRTLRPEGMLAIWSAGADSMFAIRLKKARFKVSIHAQKPWRASE